MELIVLVGLQGSGKTTFYRERFAATHEHVSKDNFRNNSRPARRQRHLPDGAWVVLRLDGRGFTRFTEERFEKPFDERFHSCMVATARAVLEDFGGLYAYTESDEISVLVPRGWAYFDREVEKVVSVSAGLASATFSLACGTVAHFDARVVVAPTDEQVMDYFRWRQADATRCALNGWCYWTLRKEGLDARAAEVVPIHRLADVHLSEHRAAAAYHPALKTTRGPGGAARQINSRNRPRKLGRAGGASVSG